MQRPPQFPAILSTRQAYQWINRINQKFKEFAALDLSTTKKAQVTHWLEAEFVTATLALEGALEGQVVARDEVMAMIQESGAQSENEKRSIKESPENTEILRLLKALRLVEERAAAQGQQATLSVEVLLQLHQAGGEATLRQHQLSSSSVRAEHLPIVLENACRWFSMASIAELNPVEQAAIALLRLLEIAPFEEANERTALVAASLFTLRNGLPPIIIKPEQASAYRHALADGLRMNTQPMVELVAVVIEQTLDEMRKLLVEWR